MQPSAPTYSSKFHFSSPASAVSHCYQFSNAITFPNYPSSLQVMPAQVNANPSFAEVLSSNSTAPSTLTVLHQAQADAISTFPAQAEVLPAQADTISPHTRTVLHHAQADAVSLTNHLSFTSPAPVEVLPAQADTIFHTPIVLHHAQADAIHVSPAQAEVLPAQADTTLHTPTAVLHVTQNECYSREVGSIIHFNGIPPHVYSSPPVSTCPNTELLFQVVTSCDSSTDDADSISRTQRIKHHLQDYPDHKFTETIIGIATYGARVGFGGPDRRVQRPNHPSIHNHMKVIDKYIEKEILAERVHELKGALPSAFFCSPLGLVPKKRDGIQTGWRMIFDLSCPDGQSVNDGIPKEFGTLQYESFQHALRIIALTGPNCLLLKKDLQAAF